MTDIQSALGVSQIKKLNAFHNRRRNIVNAYNTAFSNIPSVQFHFESSNCNSNFHLYILLIDFERIGIDRPTFMHKLKARGVQMQVHYIPVHTQPYYQKYLKTKWGECPNAKYYDYRCLSIPLFPAMTEKDVQKVIDILKNIY
jgi:dTDP-4-amino-4,6-dideoxygalactose transaminase